MKKLIILTAVAVLGLTGFALKAAAHDDDERIEQPRPQEPIYEDRGPRFDDRRRSDRRKDPDPIGRLNREVEHLNRMVEHVGGEMRAYGADRRIYYRYQHIRDEASRLNSMFQRGVQYYDRRRIREQIEHMHAELHQIEQDLHVRADGYYQWR